jgi:hypothetical protein
VDSRERRGGYVIGLVAVILALGGYALSEALPVRLSTEVRATLAVGQDGPREMTRAQIRRPRVQGTGSPSGGGGVTCDASAANDAAFDSAVAAATSGQTVCMSANTSYSTTGTDDNTPITITASDGVSPDLTFSLNNGDGNLTINGRRETWNDTTGVRLFNGSGIYGTPGPDNVTIRDAFSTENTGLGAAQIQIDGPTTATILIEHVRFTGVDFGTEATIRVDGGATDVTVSESLFHDQHGDGVKIGGSSYVTVLNSKFMNIDDNSVRSPGADIHSDMVQINSEDAGATLRGNWIDTCQQGITAFDQMDASLIEHNVVQDCASPSGHSITLMFDYKGSTHRHNTIVNGPNYDCSTSPGKQTQYPGVDPGTPAVYNNLFTPGMNLGSGGGLCVPTRNDHNMLQSGATGSNFNGTPTYVGGATPSTFDEFADFCLTGGSAGATGADDSTQVGVCGGAYSAATYGPPTGEGY